MATGLVVADNDISVGGRVSPGAQLSRVKTYQFTDGTDATADDITGPNHTVLGTGQTIILPTKGLIDFAVTFRGVCGSGENLYVVPGVRISATNYFVKWDEGGSDKYGTIGSINSQNQTVNFNAVATHGALTDAGSADHGGRALLDIERAGFSTGSQSVEFIYANARAQTVDIQGSTGFTTRGYMTIWDFS